MPLAWKDRVKQAVAAGGTGTLTLGAAPAGFQALGAAESGLLVPYVIEDGSAWEIGVGTYTHAGTTLARTQRYNSSTGAALDVSTSATFYLDLSAVGAAAADGAAHAMQPGGRLTLVSGVPLPTADAVGATTIYYTPYLSAFIPLWDGQRWRPTPFSEVQLQLGTVAANTNYDYHAHRNASTGAVEPSIVPWRNSGQAITGATNATPIVITAAGHGLSNGDEAYIDGVRGNTSANGTWTVAGVTADTFQLQGSTGNGAYIAATGWFNARNGAVKPVMYEGRFTRADDPARLYLGSFRTTSTTTTEDSRGGGHQSGGKRFLWNMYNRDDCTAAVIDTTNNWSYASPTIRQANGSAGNRVEVMLGMPAMVRATIVCTVAIASMSHSAIVGVGVDSTTVFSGLSDGVYFSGGGGNVTLSACSARRLSAGYHYLAWLERGSTNGFCAFLGDNGDAPGAGHQSGLIAELSA